MSTASHNAKHMVTQERPSRHIGRHCTSFIAHGAFLMGALLLSLDLWLLNTWAELSPDEILFHLRASVGGTDTTVIWAYLTHYLPFVLAGFVLAFTFTRLCKRKSVRSWTIGTIVVALLGIALAGGAVNSFATQVGLEAFLPDDGSDFIGDHFVSAKDVEISFPEKKRNLIYIFLESMELTYADEANGGAEDVNLIPELTQLAHDGETFAGNSDKLNGGIVLPGCGWTMGGMFCQSSGVPLKLPTEGNLSGVILQDFFPELVCLGDLLADQGYQQHLILGSDASFGNRREYYTQHGNFDIDDYPRALDEGFIPEGYKVFWGYEDEKLFDKARNVITEAAKGDKPFNVTMLTVDTHFEDGYVCHLCGKEHGDNQYANVMRCSSRQVSELVRWIQDQDFYNDTTIVLCGDHTTMDKDFCNNVPESYQRRTFTCILNSATKPNDQDATRSYTTLDLFPTTLAALGCKIEGDRLGIGTNLYSQTPTLVEELGLDTCVSGCNRRSQFLDGYSHAPTGEELVDAVLNESKITLTCEPVPNSNKSTFICKGIKAFNKSLIESSHLDVTDAKTGKTASYPMTIRQTNQNDVNKYDLVAEVDTPQSDLSSCTAECHVTIKDDRDRVFATWSGADRAA